MTTASTSSTRRSTTTACSRSRASTSRYLLPMMVEIQWWDFKRTDQGERDDPSLRRVRAAGLEARVHGMERGRRVGAHEGGRAARRDSSATTTSGCTTTSRPCRAASRRTCSRRSRRSPRWRSTPRRSGSASSSRAPRTATPGCSPRRPRASTCSPGGRLILGLGAGWYDREYQAYGIPYPSAGTRLQILEETLEVVKRLWTEETVTYAGQAPRVRRRVLRPEADPAAARDLGRRRRREGDAAHRGPARRRTRTGRSAWTSSCTSPRSCGSTATTSGATSTRSCARTAPTAASSTREADLDAWLDSPSGGALRRGSTPHDEYVRDNLVGTVEQVAEKVQAFVDAGCREFVLWFRDYPSTESSSGSPRKSSARAVSRLDRRHRRVLMLSVTSEPA